MSRPTPRQVLYALVSGGLVAVVAVLAAGAAVSGLAPGWWTAAMAVAIAAGSLWLAVHWRRTGPALLVGIGLLVVWLVGTLAVT